MDLVTQLQNQVDYFAFLAFNSLGTIQRDAPSDLNMEIQNQKIQQFTEQIAEMSNSIKDTSNKIDTIVESLPGINQTENEQIDILTNMEEENQKLGLELEEIIKGAESQLLLVRECLATLTNDSLSLN